MSYRARRSRVRRVSSHSTISAPRSACSTRNVTSSRFPIGVAHTASGMGYSAGRKFARANLRPRGSLKAAASRPLPHDFNLNLPLLPVFCRVQRLERDEARADEPRFPAELRRNDAHAIARRQQRLAQHDLTRRIEQELVRRLAESAADDHDLRIEDVDERADRRPESVSDRAQQL